MYADLGLRGMILSLLSSYSIEWLKFGLESVFNTTIVDPSLNLMTKSGRKKGMGLLRTFIVERVLSDETILKKYTFGKKCKVPSGKFGKLYKDDLSRVSLERMITLVAFLDNARTQSEHNILSHVPRLFTLGGDVKASTGFMNVLCREFLKGEVSKPGNKHAYWATQRAKGSEDDFAEQQAVSRTVCAPPLVCTVCPPCSHSVCGSFCSHVLLSYRGTLSSTWRTWGATCSTSRGTLMSLISALRTLSPICATGSDSAA